MFDIKMNTNKNALLCVLSGNFDVKEAQAYADKFKEGVDKLKPGFVVISDLRRFSPAIDEAKDILQDAIKYSVSRGLSRVIRVVADSVGSKVGSIQLSRTARELGYEVEIVNTMEEAKKKLDKNSPS